MRRAIRDTVIIYDQQYSQPIKLPLSKKGPDNTLSVLLKIYFYS